MTLGKFLIAEIGLMGAIWLVWTCIKVEPIKSFLSVVLALVAVFVLLVFCGVLNMVGV